MIASLCLASLSFITPASAESANAQGNANCHAMFNRDCDALTGPQKAALAKAASDKAAAEKAAAGKAQAEQVAAEKAATEKAAADQAAASKAATEQAAAGQQAAAALAAEKAAAPLCQGSCPLLHFSSISCVGGIGR